MNRLQLLLLLTFFLAACSVTDHRGTIAQLRNVEIKIEEEQIEGGLEKAIASYQHFLEEATGSAMAPEAIRRLADLKVEKEYGLIAEGEEVTSSLAELTAPEPPSQPQTIGSAPLPETTEQPGESDSAFENRMTNSFSVDNEDELEQDIDDLERVGALEAIELYQKLLTEYPLYERNDQVLYQMSRAYEELGRIEEAMEVMNRLVREFPQSRYLAEVQFRRAEYFFIHRDYLSSEDAYASIVAIGVSSSYFQLALYKLGWTFYKQELYEDALHRFIALLDHKVSIGYDFEQTEDESEHKRMEDTFRVISLGFSYLGGAESVVEYFSDQGHRSYEDKVYGNLGEYYFSKRRYSDAVDTYSAFISLNAFHRMAPHFHMRVIEINIAGGFPSLVIEAKKAFATHYGLKAEYWQYFEPSEHQDVLGYLKTNLTDLGNHYHALYQNKKYASKKATNFAEAQHWYQEFLVSFPKDVESPDINYQLADLLLENHSFADAAVEYENTAYDYELHEQSSQAGYAAVYAYRKHLDSVNPDARDPVKLEIVRSSLKFAKSFPEHEKAAIILGAAADDLYAMGDFERSLAAGQNLLDNFSTADTPVLRAAWLVVGHSSYELVNYSKAEVAYVKVLELLPEDDKDRPVLIDNLAATIYKQGEQANVLEDYLTAAEHFLRISSMAPTSTIRPTAEYDAAAALIQLQDWSRSITVLKGFRDNFPEHELQFEVTKKIAHVYREDGQFSLAAEEYERIERESLDDDVRRDALLIAAQLYEEAHSRDRALSVYQRFVGYFPLPVELNLETRSKIAEILKEQDDQENYLNELRQIIAIDASAGNKRTDRTRYLAAKGALVLAELNYEQFVLIRIVKPFKANLRKKQKTMKAVTQEFSNLIDYEVGEVTAAATFYLAEIYADFSRALMESERPDGLSALEMEEYEMAIEEQAYPFEEKSITVHESNLELMSLGVYNLWIDKSLAVLALSVPARYAKPEEQSTILTSLVSFSYELAGVTPVTVTGGTAMVAEPGSEEPALVKGEAEPLLPPADAEKIEAETVSVGSPEQKTATEGQVDSETELTEEPAVEAEQEVAIQPEVAAEQEVATVADPDVEVVLSTEPEISSENEVVLESEVDDSFSDERSNR